jgi:predicted O-methyltransferase YrrM
VNLEAEYRQRCRAPSDIREHLPVFVRLCEKVGARKVIELGTRSGVSTVGWLYGLRDQGHLWSVDLDAGPPLDWPHWTFVRGDDLDPAVVGQLPSDADIVFVDTSHDYQHTRAELNVYATKVRPGGRLVLHDTELRQPAGVGPQPPYPVKRAVTEFCADEALAVEFLPNSFGLAMIEVN